MHSHERDAELSRVLAKNERLRQAYKLLEAALRASDHRQFAAARARARWEDQPEVTPT